MDELRIVQVAADHPDVTLLVAEVQAMPSKSSDDSTGPVQAPAR